MADPTNDIDALLRHLDNGYWPAKHAALAALVAERDSLKQRVAVLESQEFTLPSDPFRDPDRDLRERLVCAALPVVIADFYNCSPNKRYDLAWHIQSAVDAADAAIAAMRKGEA